MTRSFRPTSLEDAVRLLGDPGLSAVAVAGCTDLLVVDHATGRTHAAVVDLLRLPELRSIRLEGAGLSLGATCTFTDLRRDPLIARHVPVIAEMAATIGGWQIQNRATLGGNLANASPAGDSLPLLLALDAEIELLGTGGARKLPYDTFHLGYRKTALRPGEIITRVHVPIPAEGTRIFFRKVGTRAAQAISKVVVAFAARHEGDRCVQVRLAAGSVGPVPLRMRGAERVAEGVALSPALADAIAEAARADVSPIDDGRSTAKYRSHVLGNLVRRFFLHW